MKYWNVEFSADETARMLDKAQLDAKNPVLPFEPDSHAKRNSASPEMRMLTEQWLSGVFQKLELQRLATGLAWPRPP